MLRSQVIGSPPPAGLTIIAQHYVIYPEYNQGYPHNYQNDAAIRQVMARSPHTILSISGHYHHGIPLTRHDGVCYFGGQAFCESPYPYYIISVEGTEFSIQDCQMLEQT